MNNNLSKILSDHLQNDQDNAIRVQSNSLRLRKSAGSAQKFAFTLSDIKEKFGSVDNLLHELPQKGFTNGVQFTLIKLYTKDGKTTYRTFEQITEDLKPREMNPNPPTSSQPVKPAATYPVQEPSNYGFGYLGAPDVLNKFVEAERGRDWKERFEEQAEKYKNLNTDHRILKEKYGALEIKLATIEDRHKLELERSEMNKKSFLDSEGGSKFMDTLGAVLTPAIEAVAKKGLAPSAASPTLGSPQIEVSPVKQMAIDGIQSPTFSDEQTNVVNYIINNWEKDFIENILALIKQRENEN